MLTKRRTAFDRLSLPVPQHPSACTSDDAVAFHQLAIECFEICHERDYIPSSLPDINAVLQIAFLLRAKTRIKDY